MFRVLNSNLKHNVKLKMEKMTELVSVESITEKIYLIRGNKVLLDRDLAELYGVPLSSKELFAVILTDFRMILCLCWPNRSWKIGDTNLAPPILSKRAFVIHPWPLPNRGWQCSQACLTGIGLYRWISRSCGHSPGCGKCWQAIRSFRKRSTLWKRNTTNSSGWSLRQ